MISIREYTSQVSLAFVFPPRDPWKREAQPCVRWPTRLTSFWLYSCTRSHRIPFPHFLYFSFSFSRHVWWRYLSAFRRTYTCGPTAAGLKFAIRSSSSLEVVKLFEKPRTPRRSLPRWIFHRPTHVAPRWPGNICRANFVYILVGRILAVSVLLIHQSAAAARGNDVQY